MAGQSQRVKVAPQLGDWVMTGSTTMKRETQAAGDQAVLTIGALSSVRRGLRVCAEGFECAFRAENPRNPRPGHTLKAGTARPSWHRLGAVDMPLEVKGFRHITVAIP